MITKEDLDNWFTYHAPTNAQLPLYEKLRSAARHFADVILECTPPSADQSDAIRKVREAVMTANASIACEAPLKARGA
jgi:hypothetical protein